MKKVVCWYNWHVEGLHQKLIEEEEGRSSSILCSSDTFLLANSTDANTQNYPQLQLLGDKKDSFVDFISLVNNESNENRTIGERKYVMGLGGRYFVLSKASSSEVLVDIICTLSGTRKHLSVPDVVHSIACSEAHVLLSTARHVYSYGYGDCGQLGLGKDVLKTEILTRISLPAEERPICISTSSEHSAIITKPGGILYTFGNCKYARLGHEDMEVNVYEPQVVETLLGVGQLLPNGTTTGVDFVACGKWHTIAASKETSDVYGWGWNKFAQLGSESLCLNKHKDAMVVDPQRLSFIDDLLEDVEIENSRIRKVFAGTRFSALLTEGGKLVTIGDTMSRQGVPGITKSSTWWKNPKELNDDSEGSVDLPKIVQIEENVLDFQCYQHSFIKIKIIS